MGSDRPRTAAMGGGGLPRPPTAVYKNLLGSKKGGATMGPGADIGFMGHRAVSA